MAWLEIEIERDNQVIRGSARGSRGKRVARRSTSGTSLASPTVYAGVGRYSTDPENELR